ncbi:MAG: hypothetical protein AAGA88_00725 [Pseudomonadota bacterium]
MGRNIVSLTFVFALALIALDFAMSTSDASSSSIAFQSETFRGLPQ